jgi:SAM-dependent methyltransferase
VLRGLVMDQLARHAPATGDFDLLDAGCGTGSMLARVAAQYPAARLHGLDVAAAACDYTRHKTRAEVRVGSVNQLPYADRQFDVVLCLDVLGAQGVDAARAMAECARTLRPGGLLVLNLAAYRWLLSYHDRAVGHASRHDRREAQRLVQAAGLVAVLATYWNTLLFPAMVLRRKLAFLFPSTAGGGGSDVHPLPAPLNAACAALAGLERGWVRRGGRLAFGGSVFIVARKQPESSVR